MYSAITLTPPCDISVIVQSRGNPAPSWIFARLLHTCRSLLRRFANMLILRPCSIMIHLAFPSLLKKNYWNLPSATPRNPLVRFG
jgi:hypothetical protein